MKMKEVRSFTILVVAALAFLGMAQYSSDEAVMGIWGVVQGLVQPFTR
jgi:hypothetical protein